MYLRDGEELRQVVHIDHSSDRSRDGHDLCDDHEQQRHAHQRRVDHKDVIQETVRLQPEQDQEQRAQPQVGEVPVVMGGDAHEHHGRQRIELDLDCVVDVSRLLEPRDEALRQLRPVVARHQPPPVRVHLLGKSAMSRGRRRVWRSEHVTL